MALLCLAGLALPALAQVPLPQAPPVPPAAQVAQDPPGRVARLNFSEGSVSFAPAGSEQWAFAELNRPLTTGDRLWVDQGARSELHVGSTAWRLGERSQLRIEALDDQTTHLSLAQGSLALRVRSMVGGERIEIDTPNLTFSVNGPGEYRLDVDPANDTTRVTLQSGLATVEGDGGTRSPLVAPRQVRFSGVELQALEATNAVAIDSLDRWATDRDLREDASTSARYVSREMTGYEALDDYGSWRTVPDYGPVWVPQTVVAGWAPYRYGHWAWIPPWGWTWVDDQPWGFAPFHYGRWAFIGNYWGWVPGNHVARPVYAPALVAFVGGPHVPGPGRVPSFAWCPLAPGEVFRPGYVASAAYVNNLNRTVFDGRNVAQSARNTYINQQFPHAVTASAATAFSSGIPAGIGRAPPAFAQAPLAAGVGRSAGLGAGPAQAGLGPTAAAPVFRGSSFNNASMQRSPSAGGAALPQQPGERIWRGVPAPIAQPRLPGISPPPSTLPPPHSQLPGMQPPHTQLPGMRSIAPPVPAQQAPPQFRSNVQMPRAAPPVMAIPARAVYSPPPMIHLSSPPPMAHLSNPSFGGGFRGAPAGGGGSGGRSGGGGRGGHR